MQPEPESIVSESSSTFCAKHSRTCARNSLPVSLVLNVSSSVNTLNVGDGCTILCDNVPILVSVDLTLDKRRGRVVANGIKEAVRLEGLFLASLDVLDNQLVHKTLVVALDLHTGGVPLDGDVLVLLEPVGHDLAGPELVPADEDSNMACVLGEEHGLLSCRITSTNDNQGLLPEDWGGTIAHGAGGDTVVPVLLLAGEAQTTGDSAGGDDDGVGGVVSVGVPLGRVLEGTVLEVKVGDGLANDLGAEALGLLAHVVHELATHDSLGEAREVLDIGGGGQLATGSRAVGHETFVQSGLEVCAGQVDGSRVGGGAGADD